MPVYKSQYNHIENNTNQSVLFAYPAIHLSSQMIGLCGNNIKEET